MPMGKGTYGRTVGRPSKKTMEKKPMRKKTMRKKPMMKKR